MSVRTIVVAFAIVSVLTVGVSTIMFTSVEAQQGSTISVSIVPGASTLTDTSFQPNPVNVKVGDTVRWTNNDNTIHTVIEGNPATGGEVEGGFASEILGPGVTFEHTFNQTGTFEYYCNLHPNMVGTVIVS
ncbi:MAG: plastocyanin/azurin family copper-binding protein [Nitrososphaeraceae archaeon]|jgi:plastocyanin